ncbi:phospho-sugar mutase [Curtobacterium flaccumfaciens]|nr:phospho-sugar mutase [Curtobacterium flaccumfaciens]
MKLDLDRVLGTARAWLAQDPDQETRDELAAAIDEAADGDGPAVRALAERFDGRLQFGTAGLRAELGWGPLRMNRVVVTQAAAGLARFLIETGRSPSVVIGYDGRVNSDVFARDSAEVMRGLGLEVTLLPSALPTPVLAFAVRHLDVGAGVMVTASHNPPRDNGYKVYLGQDDDGSQIVPPVDGEIAAAIDAVAAGSVADLPRGTDYTVATSALVDAYVAATAAIVPAPALPLDEQPKVVYTAMHGVGWETARAVFAAAGFAEPAVVPEQIDPDGAFPTVSFPNPEEPGAMDLAIARGVAVGADLVIANDPDADRLALAIPTASDAGAPSYRRLSGNEVGWLLGWRAAARASESGATGTLAASIVSSPALARVAARHGLEYRDTLTGFKWVSRGARAAVRLRGSPGLPGRPVGRARQGRHLGGAGAAVVGVGPRRGRIVDRRAARRLRRRVRGVRLGAGRDPGRRPVAHRRGHGVAPVHAACVPRWPRRAHGDGLLGRGCRASRRRTSCATTWPATHG